MPVQKTETTEKKEVLKFKENPDATQNLKSKGLPYCKVCGSGFRVNLEGEKFCPNHKKDCPMLSL